MGYAPGAALVTASASTGPLAPIVFGILSAGALLLRLFGGAPRGDFQKFSRTIYPHLERQAAATGRNAYAWWFGDIVEVRPDGTFAAVASFTDMNAANDWLIDLARRVAIEVIVCAGDFLTDGPGVCHFETWEPAAPEPMEPPPDGGAPPIDIEQPPIEPGEAAPPGTTTGISPTYRSTILKLVEALRRSGASMFGGRAAGVPGTTALDSRLASFAPWLLLIAAGAVVLTRKRK
jgi:hypothetical protein